MPNTRRLVNLGSLSPEASEKLTHAATELVDGVMEDGDKPRAQALLEAVWDLCAEHEPDIGTMALFVAGLTARTLSMFRDQGVPTLVVVPALSMLTALITEQQLQRDEEHAGAGHA
jgi:hypothetical protein